MEFNPMARLHPSNSTPTLKVANDRPPSIHTTGSRVPPVLTSGPSEQTGRNISIKHRFSGVSVPTRKSSKANLASQSPDGPVLDNPRRPGIVCIDPTIHPPGAHAEIHHPGLVVGADFCDAGFVTDRDSPIRTPPTKLSPVNPSKPILTGRVRRLLSGGDTCEEIVDVSEHVHKNHTSAVKVRPATGLLPRVDATYRGHAGISKVQPADYGNTKVDKEIIHQRRPSVKIATPEKPDVVEHPHHGHHLTPKVRPHVDRASLRSSGQDMYPNDIHGGHIWVPKVQPYHESSPLLLRTEENSIPGVAVKVHPKKDDDPPTAASYWGFLPGFGVKKDEKTTRHSSAGDDFGGPPMPLSESRSRSVTTSRPKNRPSLSASQYSNSQKSSDIVPKAVTKTTDPAINQENAHQDDGNMASLRNLFGNLLPQEDTAPEKKRVLSTASASPTTRPHPVDDESEELEQNTSSEQVDPWRAANWLRQLLGYPESSAPNLTQLPEKSHPRHEKHNDYPGDEAGAIPSRVTTFSGENAADMGTMHSAVHNLERLLNEALFLANEVTGQDHCEHAGDEPSKVSPNTFLGAIESPGHGCGDLPSASARNDELLKPDMYSGNVIRSSNKEPNVRGLRKSERRQMEVHEIHHHVLDEEGTLPNSREVKEYIRVYHEPPITPRDSSMNLREGLKGGYMHLHQNGIYPKICHKDVDVCSLDGSDDMVGPVTQSDNNKRHGRHLEVPAPNQNANQSNAEASVPQGRAPPKRTHEVRNISLRRRSHVSLRDGQRFSLTRSVRRHPTIARDWSPLRKRFVASVACISTALVGVLIGIYAGLVPSIQYVIADFHHYSIIGNVGLYLGMALSTFFCWPLPLLHGRKPYILCSLCVAMPLLFPQAIAVSTPRSPYTSVWRWALLLPRGIMGFALGFANMNFHSILTDLFGASLMSSNPHQEVVDQSDVRRHGGGLGVWLGIWTWCFIGSLGIGFLVGALVIDTLRPSWGLYISIMSIAVVLFLNVICPEVRRSAWRRSVAEVRTETGWSRRVARGEIMMHRVGDGPTWWGQEMYHGMALSLEMLRQPGFVVMAFYSAWIYAQVVLIIVLLGSLSSRHYHFRSPFVGAAVSSVAVGALAAVPFQKANIFSRSRSTGPITNSMTFDRMMTWTSHLVRRAVFVIVLPIAGILYTIVSSGPPVHLVFPCIFAALIGFLSCLAIAECNGMLMEAWDTSDLQPGMTGRSRSGKDNNIKRTNYSSFPRVTAGWNTIHSIGFILAAGATGIGGIATRSLGQRAATGVVASILFLFSLLILGVFARFRRLQIIPNSKSVEMERWTEERRDSLRRRASAIAAAKANGLHDVTEIPEDDVGSLTRWSEIRKKNRLIDEGVHLNRQAVGLARDEIGRRGEMLGEIVRKVSKRSARSKRSHNGEHEEIPRIELEDLGPLGPPHQHDNNTLHPEVYSERECVMGQTVREEMEDLSSIDGELDEDHEWNYPQEHSSHMISKVQPYAGQEQSASHGQGDYVINMNASTGEHASHGTPKVKPADPNGSEHREQHGAHMRNKVKPAQTEIESVGKEHGGHMGQSKVKQADANFEEVDLGGKSDRRDSKTLKQD
ncbi:uncharacterized protein F4822DRAFT_442894 [Hypoxylon trugodes]|uniref:uncharacterized protein n=1 Tax=Hypoxylon trugodes TaxID=326681 RepID=UPI00218E587D|nr:uncharacterized protein F4822DRAFT_442894 [Hypoxylon trugodes]KAI1389679.1 hypothetical protein F4822DRAFT_442894 [Hypoxylon trugodes]